MSVIKDFAHDYPELYIAGKVIITALIGYVAYKLVVKKDSSRDVGRDMKLEYGNIPKLLAILCLALIIFLLDKELHREVIRPRSVIAALVVGAMAIIFALEVLFTKITYNESYIYAKRFFVKSEYRWDELQSYKFLDWIETHKYRFLNGKKLYTTKWMNGNLKFRELAFAVFDKKEI